MNLFRNQFWYQLELLGDEKENYDWRVWLNLKPKQVLLKEKKAWK